MDNSLLIQVLKEALDRAEKGRCSLSPEQQHSLIGMLTHVHLNKEQASRFLHMSRAKFDREIKAGRLPKGRKDAGSTSLYWYEDELRELSKES